ncbi:MAG: hypothetical protein J0653_03105, partial [Deltaproteobacteria bacterium]|nr:hypothetical protein [Deltaproteobacteria bacterium]
MTTAQAETIHCGNKTIVVQDGKLTQITHEDGSTHSGGSISENWQYNGKSIKHRLDTKAIPCGTKPKSRDELSAESAAKFTQNPSLYGLSVGEAKLLSKYARKLMAMDSTCVFLVDGAKSTQRKDMYYIDCRDVRGEVQRRWLSRGDLAGGDIKAGPSTIGNDSAERVCHDQLRSKVAIPSTYRPSSLGTTSRAVPENGRNIVEIEFSAKNSLGGESTYRGKCII